jgi:MtrB/PioB family decaheme-associated outer membrane protein
MCGGLWVLALAPGASAQARLGGYRLDADVEAGVQFFVDEPSRSRSAKFEEYRSVPEGLFLERLRLRIFSPDELYSAGLGGANWGRRDQEFSLGTARLGLWQAEFDWDQTPHVYSRGTARLLATDIGRSVFVLPSPRPLLSTYNSGQVIDEVGVRWDTARLTLLLTPSPEWELKGEYTRIHKEGTRAIAMSYQTPMNNFAEFLEPINQTMHDFRMGGTYAAERWQIRFGYAFSMFENFRTSVTGDNPCFGLAGPLPNQCTAADGAPGVPGAPSAEERGRVSLAPDNMAHTFTLGGGVSLPMRTRVNANLSYSLRLQNEPFLPHTITPYIASDPGLFLPDKSLDGMVGVFLGNLNVTSRPLPPLTLSLKYRIYDYNDMSNHPSFPCSVESDSRLFCDAGAASSPFGPAREAKRYAYTRQNAELDARWRFGGLAALTLGVGSERWDRNSIRNVRHSDEPFAKAVLALTPTDWLLARLSYQPSFRRDSNYDPQPTHIAQDQSPLMRKFDQAERNRQRADLLLQITPTDTITTALTGSWRADEYIGSPLGVQQDVDWSAGADFTWTPGPRFAFTAGYVHDWNFTKQHQQTIFPSTIPLGSYEWVSNNTDSIDTFRLQAKAALIPRTLDIALGASYAYAIGRIETRNLASPTGGTAGQNQQAIALRMPAFEDELVRLDLALTYHFAQYWSATLGYAFEMWRKTDFRTDTLNPFTPGISSVFLGEDYKSYTAHIVGMTLGFRFK